MKAGSNQSSICGLQEIPAVGCDAHDCCRQKKLGFILAHIRVKLNAVVGYG